MDWQEHNAMRDKLMKEMIEGTPRYMRAMQFTRQVMALMQDFIPRDRECLRRIEDTLMLDAFRGDVEIVHVPPGRDAERKAALRAAEVSLTPVSSVWLSDGYRYSLDANGKAIKHPD